MIFPRQSLKGPLAAVLLAASLAVCESTTEPEVDPSICQPTYEFGNFGCADVRGYVTGASGQGLYGYRVGISSAEGTNQCCGSGLATTDSTGYYSFRVFWWTPTPFDPDFVADTATLKILANRRPNSPSDTVSRRSAVIRLIRFSPVGAKAHINLVDLEIDI
jgi:hypothetical protein